MTIYVAILNVKIPISPTLYIWCENKDMALEIATNVFKTKNINILFYADETLGGKLYNSCLKFKHRGYFDTSAYNYSDFIGYDVMEACGLIHYYTRTEKIKRLGVI